MSTGKKCSTTGYKYYLGLHLVFCQKVDKAIKFLVGGKEIWNGDISASTTLDIDKKDLFGGEDSEGGISGTLDVCFGEEDQPQNSYLADKLGAITPAFRGLFALVSNQMYVSANSPYIKDWTALLQRTNTGWRDDLSGIEAPDGFIDMNPAHIIYDTVTNNTWGGLGHPESDLDMDSFLTVANRLVAEDFGLSLIWAKNTSAEEFIGIILDHIDGRLFFSHKTGLLTLTLIRNDHGGSSSIIFDESNVKELVEFKTQNVLEAVNQVTISYVDRENNSKSVTVQDLAGLNRTNGSVNAITMDFVGIASDELANKVAARELQQIAMPMASVTIVANRENSTIEPGSVFTFNWAPSGISNMLMRVDTVEYNSNVSNEVRIVAVRDVYGVDNVSFSNSSGTLWETPDSTPEPAENRAIEEITYWQFVNEYLGDSQAVLDELTPTSTLVTAYCTEPNSDCVDYSLWTRNVGTTEWLYRDIDSFPYVAPIATIIYPEVASVISLDTTEIDIDLVKTGMYAYIEDEIVAITAVDAINFTVTVDRGVLDTIPVEHADGSLFIVTYHMWGLDSEARDVGEQVEAKMLIRTSLGTLELDEAPTDTRTLVGRMMRPYPPGNVQLNGERWPTEILDELTITWAHRDRTQQTVSMTRQDVANIGPEIDVTYSLKIYGETDTLLRTVTGLTLPTYTYEQADEETDSGLTNNRLNEILRIELWSVNTSAITSLQTWNLTVTRPLPPINVVAPIISGTNEVGDTLTVTDDGTWELI